MQPKLALPICALSALLLAGCSKSDRERANEESTRAKEKTHEDLQRAKVEAHKLGNEAKDEAHQLSGNIERALGPAGSTSEARHKLDNAGQVAKTEGAQAARKIDRAALIAKVKTKLAADVGLATVSSVEVDATGHVVTLRGTVSSEDQKRAAERAVSQLDGVTQVVDQLVVQP